VSKTVVVTGASGFVGKILTKELTSLGFKVIALDFTDPCLAGVRFIGCDIGMDFDFSKFEIPRESIFVHLAALSTDTQCKQEPSKAMAVNLLGTQRVLELAKATSSSHFIFASSEWVYPERQTIEPQLESDKLSLSDLNSLYAMTKLMAENVLRVNSLIPTTILRFGIVYGPRVTPGSAPESIVLKVSSGEKIELGSTKTSRRFIYVDDLVEAIIRCANSYPTQKFSIFNVSGDTLTSLKDIVEIARFLSRSNSEILSKESVPSIRNPDPTKFEDTFGKITKTSLKEGLEKCLNEMQKAD
jgi:UDP-glucose 4-epimerase